MSVLLCRALHIFLKGRPPFWLGGVENLIVHRADWQAIGELSAECLAFWTRSLAVHMMAGL